MSVGHSARRSAVGLASAAGSALGLEAEALSGEDRGVEGAKNFVRLAGDAVKGAVTAAASAPAAAVAQAAVTAAAQKHAPGLLRGAPGSGRGGGRTGLWVRRGSTIVIELPETGPTEGLSFELETSQPTLRQGSRGSAVTTLQARLKALRFDPGPIDGIFGSQTASAVRAFQSARRIQVDGVVGPQTWGALYASEAPPPQSPWTPRPGTGSGRRPVHLTVPFYGYQSNDKEGCFGRCTEMAAAVGVTVGGPDIRIQAAVREDIFGRVTIDSAKAHEGLAYIDAQLDARHRRRLALPAGFLIVCDQDPHTL
jgi:peptidoglycan hydrolase-like protein with peptidoglycan-binding domain